jgi:hypothetical protein
VTLSPPGKDSTRIQWNTVPPPVGLGGRRDRAPPPRRSFFTISGGRLIALIWDNSVPLFRPIKALYRRTSPSLSLRAFIWAGESSLAVIWSAPTSFLLAIRIAVSRLASPASASVGRRFHRVRTRRHPCSTSPSAVWSAFSLSCVRHNKTAFVASAPAKNMLSEAGERQPLAVASGSPFRSRVLACSLV